MTRWVIPLLRVLLAMLLGALVVAELVVLPAAGFGLVQAYPRAASVELPVVAVGELVLVCVQIALACTWCLLTLVERERIFLAPTAFRWVDTIVAATTGAAVLIAGSDWVLVDGGLGGTTVTVTLLAAAVFGMGFALLVLVMRALLRQAVQLRAELAEVI